MILLLFASLLLFFIVYFTGIAAITSINRFFSFILTANFFEVFIFGLMTCFIYFNLLSFFTAVDYKALLLLLPVSITAFVRYTRKNNFPQQLTAARRLFFSGRAVFITVPILLLLFIYWIIPPFNADSGEYHYIAIRWFEQYKVVPGLANVHGRLAFNPASFIISAAFSFTNLAGQPLYPLNGVLVLLFYAWIIKKILTAPHHAGFNCVLLICSILLFRTTLVNTSSPSSDLLSSLLLFYSGFRMYELIIEKKNAFGDYFAVMLFTCFAVTAKLSAVPSLLLLPFILTRLKEKNNLLLLLLKTSLPLALLMLPWLARNAVLSGYLLYPVPGSNLIPFDWTVPHNVVKLDYIFSRYGPRTKEPDFIALQKMNLYQLTVVLIQNMYIRMRFSLALVAVSFLSVFTWLRFLPGKIKIIPPIFILWCIYYTCLCIWFINSPELRFGLAYAILCTTIPLFELTRLFTLPQKAFLSSFSMLLCACLVYYVFIAVQKGEFDYYSINKYWLKPARDNRYLQKNDIPTFPSAALGNGVTLYYPDAMHDCLNSPGPCMNWRYGEIEMRGTQIQDGFRNTKDEVKKFFPFVDAGNQ